MAETKLKLSGMHKAIGMAFPSAVITGCIGFTFGFAGGALGGLSSAIAAPSSAQPSAILSPVAASSSTALPVLPGALTFQAWKLLRTEEARLILERLTLEGQIFAASSADRTPGERQAVLQATPSVAAVSSSAPRSSPRAAVRPRQDNRVEQARMNLEIAQDLTINDYLQIYLSQFKTAEVLRDVARRMNPEEVAELLIAYQKTSTHGDAASASAAGNSHLCSGAAR